MSDDIKIRIENATKIFHVYQREDITKKKGRKRKRQAKKYLLHAVKNVSLVVKRGEVVLVIGPSGSGKSTLLRCINRLETLTQGTIWIDDICVTDPKVDIRKVREEAGMVFQSFNLFPHINALKNIAFAPIIVKGMKREEAYEKARSLLARVGLADKEDSYPGQLSGGQQQRVAIARSLSNDPEVVLADEPTGNLDTKSGMNVMQFLEKLHKQKNKTIVMVTHDEKLAKNAERIEYLEDGKIINKK